MIASAQHSKNEATLCYYTDQYHFFFGRVIGYVDNKQFAAVMKNVKLLSKKLSTMPSADFCDLMSKQAVGLRLVFITKDNHELPHIIFSGIIIDINSTVDYNGFGDISFVDNKQNLFNLGMEI